MTQLPPPPGQPSTPQPGPPSLPGPVARQPYPLLAIGSVIAVGVWLLLPENDQLGAENLKLWTVFVVAAALALLAPMLAAQFKLSPAKAWQICAGGAAAIGFAWVAFLLPSINSNHAFFGTIAAVAAGFAAWTAPGRPA